jgi:hypothetical protein
MSNLHKEVNFETEVRECLASNGWLHIEVDIQFCNWIKTLFPAEVQD